MLKFLVALLLCGSAYAQTPNPPVFQSGVVTPTHNACWTTTGVIQDCGPGTPVPIPFPLGTLPILSATTFGVKADGVTSDDVAMKSATDACALIGAKLILPPGRILLTGAATSTIHNCSMEGAGVPTTSGLNNPGGTTFYITSTTNKPFILGTSFSLIGFNVYYPNQGNGTTVYPATFSDNGSQGASHGMVTNVNMINPYDGFVQTAGTSWGDIKFNNNTMWAAHDLFALSNTGDSFAYSNMRFTPGGWLSLCNFSCQNAVNAGIAVNKIWHITAPSGGGAVTIAVSSTETCGWRYGIQIDSGGSLASSDINVAWDCMGTLIDTSAGGNFAAQNIFTGIALCSLPVFGGVSTAHNPCFNLSNQGSLFLDGFYINGSQGSIVETAGASVYLLNSHVDGLGAQADGGSYSLINVTGGTPEIVVQNGRLHGKPADVNVHGIQTGGIIPAKLLITNNEFSFFNEVVNVTIPSGARFSGNQSFNTTGTASLVLAGLTTTAMVYSSNNWDKPPLATVANCGAGATITGTLSGFVHIGSTIPTTSCDVTPPFAQIGSGGGPCLFNTNHIVFGGPSGVPPVWHLQFGPTGAEDAHGDLLFYNCSSSQ